MSTHVRFKDLTDAMCCTHSSTDSHPYLIPTRKLPPVNKFDNSLNIRNIDIEAPIVYGYNENKLRRLKHNKIETDSSHHNN